MVFWRSDFTERQDVRRGGLRVNGPFVPHSELAFEGSPEVVFGEGTLESIQTLLARLGARRGFLVLDRPAYKASGAEARLESIWRRFDVAIFEGFRPNPILEDVERGLVAYREFEPDAIIAIGGGSALDMAKAIRACGNAPGSARERVTGPLPVTSGAPPLIAVPTTSGTGSEATHFAVVYVDGKKHSFSDPALRPDHAILDPTLTYGLPPSVTVASGLDAVCQALESIWSVNATDRTEELARTAAAMALQGLPEAVREGTPTSRRTMMAAAHLAGRAIDITKTTAPHAASYGLTSRFGTPHGLAVALTFPGFLRLNGSIDDTNGNDPRGREEARRKVAEVVRRLGARDIEEACAKWIGFLEILGAPTRLSEIGVKESDLGALADGIDLVRLANHPRHVSKDEVMALLRERL
ncbi:iron-containing alcohol dehydrogenase family protein [bacterium]|nr:MAG: iron-containing alcohol dehydrogenase family protein [bacterium]